MKLVVSWTHTRIAWCLGALMVVLLSILPFTLAPSQALAQAATSPVELTQGWQYRWGESPVDETGIPICAQETISSPNWQSFRFPKKLDKPPEAEILWLRVPLPAGQWKSPAVYLRSVPYMLGVYIHNQRIYSQYSLTASGTVQLIIINGLLLPLGQIFLTIFCAFKFMQASLLLAILVCLIGLPLVLR